jgi:hypothetical protein
MLHSCWLKNALLLQGWPTSTSPSSSRTPVATQPANTAPWWGRHATQAAVAGAAGGRAASNGALHRWAHSCQPRREWNLVMGGGGRRGQQWQWQCTRVRSRSRKPGAAVPRPDGLACCDLQWQLWHTACMQGVPCTRCGQAVPAGSRVGACCWHP